MRRWQYLMIIIGNQESRKPAIAKKAQDIAQLSLLQLESLWNQLIIGIN